MPDISKITLPSGTTYDIKDAVARQAIAGGVSFIIAWDGSTTPVVAEIPKGVVVIYNGTSYTGTLETEDAQVGAFYLIKDTNNFTKRSEIVNAISGQGAPGPYYVLDKQLLSTTDITLKNGNGIVVSSSLYSVTKNSEQSVISFTQANYDSITKPITATYLTESLDIYDEYVPVDNYWEKIGNTEVDLKDVVTNVFIATKPTATVIGSGATLSNTQPTVALATGATAGTGVVSVATGINSASASGGNVAWNSKDSVTALTGLGIPSTQTAVKSVSPTTAKLATSTVTGVQSSTTTASKATAATSQTTATGTGTTSSTNTDWLKGVSVSNETLTIGAATLNTQTTTQQTFSDVTVPIKANSATTVATGSTTSSGSGADIVTDVSVGDTFNAVTGYASPTSDTVIGTDSTFTVTQPTITVTPTTTNVKATASGGGATWSDKDQKTVVSDVTITVTKGN